jgi:hypothetical protein
MTEAELLEHFDRIDRAIADIRNANEDHKPPEFQPEPWQLAPRLVVMTGLAAGAALVAACMVFTKFFL